MNSALLGFLILQGLQQNNLWASHWVRVPFPMVHAVNFPSWQYFVMKIGEKTTIFQQDPLLRRFFQEDRHVQSAIPSRRVHATFWYSANYWRLTAGSSGLQWGFFLQVQRAEATFVVKRFSACHILHPGGESGGPGVCGRVVLWGLGSIV